MLLPKKEPHRRVWVHTCTPKAINLEHGNRTVHAVLFPRFWVGRRLALHVSTVADCGRL